MANSALIDTKIRGQAIDIIMFLQKLYSFVMETIYGTQH